MYLIRPGKRHSLLLMISLIGLAVITGCTTQAIRATPSPEPIVPTRTPQPAAEPTEPVGEAIATAPDVTATAIPTLTAGQIESLNRIGVAGALAYVEPAARLGIRFGHLTFWRVAAELPDAPDLTVWQTVRLGPAGEGADWPKDVDAIEAALQAQPGSFWLVGNEPDVRWQDNVTAAEYAERYHDVYTFIKERDPSAKVGAGGEPAASGDQGSGSRRWRRATPTSSGSRSSTRAPGIRPTARCPRTRARTSPPAATTSRRSAATTAPTARLRLDPQRLPAGRSTSRTPS